MACTYQLNLLRISNAFQNWTALHLHYSLSQFKVDSQRHLLFRWQEGYALETSTKSVCMILLDSPPRLISWHNLASRDEYPLQVVALGETIILILVLAD